MKQECKDCNKSLDDCTCIEDTIDMKKETTLEEVLGSSMCQFSVIENKLAILYRNQVKIYDAITKEQQGYSLEDLECAWNSSDQNMRFQFSSSAYKGITFKQWLEKYENER
jgi:hypothetical protein